MTRRPAWRRILEIALALLLVGLTAYQAGRLIASARTVIELNGGGAMSFPVDDSFIYLQYARAIAQGHPFVYTPGNGPTTGATSLGYPLLLVPPHLVGAPPSIAVAWTLGLGIVFYFLTALLSVRLGTALGGWPAGLIAGAFVIASPHVLWGSMSGMEIGFYATILLATVLAYLKEREEGRFPRLRWWALALATARPEGAILCGVLALFVARDAWKAGVRDGQRRSPLPIVLCLAAAALPFLVNLVVSGSFESTSSQAKSILAEPYVETKAAYLKALPEVWVSITKTFLAFLLPMRPVQGGMAVPPVFLWTSTVGLVVFAAAGFAGRARARATGLPLALIAVAILFGAIPAQWWAHHWRYLQGPFPLYLTVVAAGWGRIHGLLPERVPRWLRAVAGILVVAIPGTFAVLPLLLEQRDMVVQYGHNSENIAHQQVAVAHWIDANLPKEAVVALNDAGAIAYYGNRTTVDLVGLTSAGYAPVFRTGPGCLFEHLRRQPRGRVPTYFAVYPDWFVYWPASGIFGPESFRAHLGFNTICGGTDMVVYPADWFDVARTDQPQAFVPAAGLARVDSLDLASLEDEARHDWKAKPQATDVLRRYDFVDKTRRPVTDAGRIVNGTQTFRMTVRPGRDATLVMRTDAWYRNRLRVSVDGADAGTWEIARAESVWVEPSFRIAGRLFRRDQATIEIRREAGAGNVAPFRYWLYQ